MIDLNAASALEGLILMLKVQGNMCKQQMAYNPAPSPHDVGIGVTKCNIMLPTAVRQLKLCGSRSWPRYRKYFHLVISMSKYLTFETAPKETPISFSSFFSPFQRFGECCEKLRVLSHAGIRIEVIRHLTQSGHSVS